MLSISTAGGTRRWKTRPQTAPTASGRKKNVLVHKFVTSGSVEERIDQMIADKRQLARELLAGGGEVDLTSLNDSELLELVRLDVSRAAI